MAFPLPPGHTAEELGRAVDAARLGELKPLEEAQAESTRLLWAFRFGWRFPLFSALAGELNWALKKLGVTPWPEYQDVVFVEASEPVWYIAWVKGVAWLAPIIGALAPILAILVAVFLGSILWRVVPQPIRQPVEDMVGALPQILPLVVIMALVFFLPRITEGLSPSAGKGE